MGYWVSDITQQCFSGYHMGWALGLGMMSVIFWCIVIPVAMGVGLFLCRAKADEDSFREHFGFLYRSYRPERMWWEAVWAARTVVLTFRSNGITVFSYPMERYYSVLSLLAVFWASAALQIIFKPYAFRTLHRLHMVSTSCLAATTLGALAMFGYDLEEKTALQLRQAIGCWCWWSVCHLLGGACGSLCLPSRAGVLLATTWSSLGCCGLWRRCWCVQGIPRLGKEGAVGAGAVQGAPMCRLAVAQCSRDAAAVRLSCYVHETLSAVSSLVPVASRNMWHAVYTVQKTCHSADW
jgi:hypothetical protein